MPTTQVSQNADGRRKEIEILLHNGHEVSLKDIGWLLYGVNSDMKVLADCMKQILCKPPSRLATVAQESLVKWAVPFAMGFVFWLLMQFVNSGFSLP